MVPFNVPASFPSGAQATSASGVQTPGMNGVPAFLAPTLRIPANTPASNAEIPPLTDLSPAAFAHLEKVARETAEYVQVMLYLPSFEVEAVYEVRNETLDMQYATTISGATKICSQIMLHGTSVASVDAFVREGFKVGGVGVKRRHGAANGRGIYLTAQAPSAASYSRKERSKYIILAETVVTPGCFKQCGFLGGFVRLPLGGMQPVAGTVAASAGEGPRPNPTEPEYDVVVQLDKTLVRLLYVVEFRHRRLGAMRSPAPKPPPALPV